jgi:ABC-type multidrug transport system fused ATPase/permease subunit
VTVAGRFTAPRSRDIQGPAWFLLWLITSQRGRIAAGAMWGSLWMIGLAALPYLLSRAIDDGLAADNAGALLGWVAALFGVGVVNAVLAIARHRTMTKVRMDASFRTIEATVRQATRLGAALPHKVKAGEVAAIGVVDVQVIARSLTATGPGFGAVVAYALVASLLFSISPLLAVVVLAGVPLLVVAVGPLLHRLQRVDTGYREQQGGLTNRLVDVLGGLRVLNGLGGKDLYADRYRQESQALCEKGYHVGRVTSWIGALSTGLPALFLAVVTWLAARMAAQGTISIGDLVAVYGYVAMLVVPVAFFIEAGSDTTRALVAARRVISLLGLAPAHVDEPETTDAPTSSADLYDSVSGVSVRSGALTALVSARSVDAATVVDRLGRFSESEATWDGVRLDTMPLRQVRERILVMDNDADLFAGSVREVVAGRGEPDDDRIRAAIHVAVADDIVDALPQGLDATITAAGHNLSGGQRQRIRLARAVYAVPDVLLAVAPTSAVDAHTEAAMASRLRVARQGRTTLVTTTSPLVLDRANVVIYLVDGKAVATGTHQELSHSEAGYRALVFRDVDGQASP